MRTNRGFIRHLAGPLPVAVLTLMAFSARAQYTNGIYAEISTSMGSVTCRLEYALAPKACANFIGLATGQRPWLDLPSGEVKTTPFYNGTTFHRVIAGFMIQGGSPNGQGTDGPGYSFPDEFSPSLRHDRFGVLSMANSGPDSNGSQFFITVEPTPWLDDVHTVFGRLYGGSNVVYAINHVATDTNNNKPLTNVVVLGVTIRRIGAEAQAFDINAQGLPRVMPLHLNIAHAGANVAITYSNRLYTDNRRYTSTNLTQWTASPPQLTTTLVSTGFLLTPKGSPTFVRMAQIQYQDPIRVPADVHGLVMTLDFAAGFGTLVINFDNAGTGTYTFGSGSGSVVGYNWIQDPYRGRLSPIAFSGIVPMVLHLAYDTAGSGTFKGTAYLHYPSSLDSFSVSGTFTDSP